jgi:hypothetical protein
MKSSPRPLPGIVTQWSYLREENHLRDESHLLMKFSGLMKTPSQ